MPCSVSRSNLFVINDKNTDPGTRHDLQKWVPMYRHKTKVPVSNGPKKLDFTPICGMIASMYVVHSYL
jgi:hypothetical protein